MEGRTRNSNHDHRFHYPQSTRLPEPKNDTPPADQSFPPHPSVRLPPNLKAAARQVPAGVGVAPRPDKRPQPQAKSQKELQAQRPQMHTPPAQTLNHGQAVQNFKFPQVPPPVPGSRRIQDLAPSSRGHYNMHNSYVSSFNEDSATPKTTPSQKSARFPTPPRASSVYPESEYPDSPQPAYPSSKIMPSSEFPIIGQIWGADSNDEDSRRPPPLRSMGRNTPVRPKLGEISPASSRTTAMDALTAAIAAGFGPPRTPSPGLSTPPVRTFSPVRMPFESNGSRPRTPEAREELEAPQLRDAPLKTPNSAISAGSTNPLLGLGINPGMSSKVPVNKRPPKLDIDVVRDMEARGSTTSLAELIRRATKLASNLDRGKTASRLDMLDFGSREKLGPLRPGDRDSTMSDLMSAFPAPAAGGTPRRDATWPLGEKGYLVDEQEMAAKSPKLKRKCCGLSLPLFISLLTIVVVLVAAAVLLPIFLVLLPKQRYTGVDFSKCATTYPCQNGGTSIVSNDACNCICSHGFIGAHCEMLGSRTDCTTLTVADGSNKYTNATMGKAIMPVFSDAQSRFDVSLNASTILSLFSLSALSCLSENQLVDFNSTFSTTTGSKLKAKRFIMLPDVSKQPPMPVPTKARIRPRQSVDSSNGIVFAASSTEAASNPTPTNSAVSTVTSLSDSATPTASASIAPFDVPEAQISFAQVVVLYVLEKSHAVSVAVNAQQKIQSFFVSGDAADSEVNVGFGELQLTADFTTLEITDGSGKSVGGN